MAVQSQGKYLAIVVAVVAIGVIGYLVLNAPDQRTKGEKIGDAVDALPNGVDKAARELKDRTPGEKLEEAAKDAGDDLKKDTNRP